MSRERNDKKKNDGFVHCECCPTLSSSSCSSTDNIEPQTQDDNQKVPSDINGDEAAFNDDLFAHSHNNNYVSQSLCFWQENLQTEKKASNNQSS